MSAPRSPKKTVESKELEEVELDDFKITKQKKTISGLAKFRPFRQSILIRQYNARFFGKESYALNKTGVCGGLVNLWCEYIASGKDLISDINLGLISLNRELAKNIGLSHKKSNTVRPCSIDEKYAALLPESKKMTMTITMEDEDKIEMESKNLYSDEARLANLGYGEAVVMPSRTIEQLTDHLDTLHKAHRSQSGLHTIMSLNLSHGVGHAISWTYLKNKEQYVLFDPNHGEYFFNDFTSFKNYLCTVHLPNLYNHRKSISPPIQLLEIADYYSSEPVAAPMPRSSP